jgi:hypothetical protein
MQRTLTKGFFVLKVKIQPYNSVLISADSQEELNITFMRFTEFYESPNPRFRNQIFTIGQLKNWYSIEYGADTYHKDWAGFNVPSSVLVPFRQGLFDPLTEQEKEFLDLFKYRHDVFYIIGAQNDSVLRHELAHALYSSNMKYRSTINNYITKNKSGLKKTSKYILNKGYCKDVLNDELQAYITDNEDEYIVKNTPSHIIQSINSIYQQYK